MAVFGGPIGTVTTVHEEQQQEPTGALECMRCGATDVNLYTQQEGDVCLACLDQQQEQAEPPLRHYNGTGTAIELRARLMDRGLPPAAIEALMRETAPARHQCRVEVAISRLWEIAGEQASPPGSPAEMEAYDRVVVPFSREARRARVWHLIQAIAIGTADAYGVGGREGVEGLGTARYPGLDSLGKGRKQAGDGAAWTAAIAGAVIRLFRMLAGPWRDQPHGCGTWPVLSWRPEFVERGDHHGLLVELTPTTAPPRDDVNIDGGPSRPDAIPVSLARPWLWTVAREGLRRAAGLRPWMQSDRMSWGGALNDWGALVEALAQQDAEDARMAVRAAERPEAG